MYDKQYGYQKGKSTEHALIEIHTKVLESLEKKENPCGVFLDFAKAFDTVDHTILLSKLHYYGIRGLPLTLITPYLSNRKECVQVNGTQSDLESISYGVPQGSICGPLLFLLYINNIAENSELLSFRLFADTTLFYSRKDINTLEEKINNELKKSIGVAYSK